MTRAIEGLSTLHQRHGVERKILRHKNGKDRLPYYVIETDPSRPWIAVADRIHPGEIGLTAIIPRTIDRLLHRSYMPNILYFHQGSPSGIATVETGFPFTRQDFEEAKKLHPDFTSAQLAENYGYRLARTDGYGYDLNRNFHPDEIDRHPEAVLYDRVFKDHTQRYGPLITSVFFHQDEDLRPPNDKKFYAYIHRRRENPYHINFELLRKGMRKIKVRPFVGLDDPNEPDLNQIVSDGVVYSYPDELNPDGHLRHSAMMDNHLVTNGYANLGVTLEFPIASKNALKQMMNVVFEDMIFPLIRYSMR